MEVLQDAIDDGRVFDAGNDLEGPATMLTGPDIDSEHALETLRSKLIAARRFAGVLTLSLRVRRPRQPGISFALQACCSARVSRGSA